MQGREAAYRRRLLRTGVLDVLRFIETYRCPGELLQQLLVKGCRGVGGQDYIGLRGCAVEVPGIQPPAPIVQHDVQGRGEALQFLLPVTEHGGRADDQCRPARRIGLRLAARRVSLQLFQVQEIGD
ncbi:hypothetical protein D3C75_846310 [compost metagenome]